MAGWNRRRHYRRLLLEAQNDLRRCHLNLSEIAEVYRNVLPQVADGSERVCEMVELCIPVLEQIRAEI